MKCLVALSALWLAAVAGAWEPPPARVRVTVEACAPPPPAPAVEYRLVPVPAVQYRYVPTVAPYAPPPAAAPAPTVEYRFGVFGRLRRVIVR